MIAAFFKIIAILFGVQVVLLAFFKAGDAIRNWKADRVREANTRLRAAKQRAEFEKLMKSGGPKTRLVSFEVRRDE
jgi:hypothetical protein